MLGIEEVRELFNQEAEVRLAHLDQLLLQLEQHGEDETLIRSIFRELHTLKGSSAVAGLDAVSHQAHELEDIVAGLRAGTQAVTADIIDVLLVGVDRLGRVIAGTRDGDHPEPGAGDHGETEPRETGPGDSLVAVESGVVVPASEPPEIPVLETAWARDSGGAVLVPMERLDELVRLIGESASAHLRVGRMLTEKFGVDPTLATEFTDLSRTLNELQNRAMRTRMIALATITDRLQRAVRDLARAAGKTINWEVRGADTELDRSMLGQLSDVLLHLVRNAVDHGIEDTTQRLATGKPADGSIRLHAMQLGSEVIIAVTDDGGGIDTARVREQAEREGIDTRGMSEDDVLHLVFHAGLSTTRIVTDLSGRGVGLDVVRANVEAAHGRVEVRSRPGLGTEFRVIVPITLAVLRCLLVESGGQRFALPFHRVVLSQGFDPSGASSVEGRPVIMVDDQPVAVATLAATLDLAAVGPGTGPIVVLADTARRFGFQVDRLVGQRDVVVTGLSGAVAHLPAVAGASVEPDGSVLIVLDPPGLIHRARQNDRGRSPEQGADAVAPSRQRILVVDDALTIRELQRSILERAGFDVRVAVDGTDALARLAEEAAELILTDIEMPNMDGFELTEAVRADPAFTNIPVLILSSRSSEADRQRGLDAGADGFILKSGFDEGSLLTAVKRLIGARI